MEWTRYDEGERWEAELKGPRFAVFLTVTDAVEGVDGQSWDAELITHEDEGELIRLLVYGSASGADACMQAAETACKSMAAAYELITRALSQRSD